MTGKEEPVGHILNETSRMAKFVIDKDSVITAQLVGNHYQRLPLVQGGLKIPCKLTTAIPGTVSNLLSIERYKKIVTKLYIEPNNEEILGSFLQPRNDVPHSVPNSSVKKKVSKEKANVQLRDIFGQEIRQDDQAVKKKGSDTKYKVIKIEQSFVILFYVIQFIRKENASRVAH